MPASTLPPEPHGPVWIEAVGLALPQPCFTTSQLVDSCASRLTDDLIGSLLHMGVDRRHSVLDNCPDLLAGPGVEPRPTTTATDLGLAALRDALDRAPDLEAPDVGLLIGVSNSQTDLMPGLAPAMLGQDEELLARETAAVNMQGQGCSAMLKALEVAGWYVRSHPDRLAAVLAAEAQTPYFLGMDHEPCRSLRELRDGGSTPGQVRRTMELTQALLFGDGATALLLGARDTGVELGPFMHLTDERADDVQLARTIGGGSGAPFRAGSDPVRLALSPHIAERAAAYAARTVGRLLEAAGPGTQGDAFLLHTGSRKVLDAVCASLGIAPEAPVVRRSYEVLRDLGNLSSVSVGFLLARGLPDVRRTAIVSAFGAGFSATATLMQRQPERDLVGWPAQPAAVAAADRLAQRGSSPLPA